VPYLNSDGGPVQRLRDNFDALGVMLESIALRIDRADTLSRKLDQHRLSAVTSPQRADVLDVQRLVGDIESCLEELPDDGESGP